MKKNVALVLSSGGARGFAHIGAIKVLEREGYKITSVAGTSMGALVGGIYASGRLKQFEEWVDTLDRMEVLKLTDISVSKKGLIRGIKIIDRIKEIVPDRNIEDLPLPYCAVATDLLKGEEQVFTTGSMFSAIRASISIPTVFQPFRRGNVYYVDGGLVNPIPINRITRSGDDILAVVNVNSPRPHEQHDEEEHHIDNKLLARIRKLQAKLGNQIPKNKSDDIGIFNLTNRSISIMLNRITDLTLADYHIDIMIEVSRESHGTYDFYRAAEIIREGEKAAEKALGLKVSGRVM
jgi:NTE family protein